MTDQGISSQSSSTQPVPSSSQSPAAPIPARTASSSCRVVAGLLCSPAGLRPGPKNGRPVRVYTAPGMPSGTPNRAWAVSSSRQASSTAREPMCFSSQITSVTPSAR